MVEALKVVVGCFDHVAGALFHAELYGIGLGAEDNAKSDVGMTPPSGLGVLHFAVFFEAASDEAVFCDVEHESMSELVNESMSAVVLIG